jgi:hypothetical protein
VKNVADRAGQNQRHGVGEQASDDGELDPWGRDPADAVSEEVARHQGDLEERQTRHPHLRRPAEPWQQKLPGKKLEQKQAQ